MNSIERLSVLLETLEAKAKQTDIQNTQRKAHCLIENNNLFSSTLFVSQSDQFIPYIKETKRKISEFSRLVAANKVELSRLVLLQIEQQISAISIALQSNAVMHQAATLSFDANKKVRIKKAKEKQTNKYSALTKNIMLNSHQLYQKLNEHHEFERRLMDMLSERENARLRCKNHESEKISMEVLALHQRLGRCRQAISAIERDIEFAEKR
ncbi:primosomal replication protein [Colwellia sp. 6_MG-2023]|uniref:primosomal replication protein n=1 Tax=Colwellia sp. 6_MG-2023 TaxID=3062676 RepID=UPI0026E2172A|nr:primosomal replication protein [Colwellia sp. 6_MG-2023]MDO6486726.1 primosomal replication protein [Colwellia sp. 6_MG-2023]